MIDPANENGDQRQAPTGSPPLPPTSLATSSLAELKSLLVGPEQEQIRELQDRLDNPSRRTDEVSRVLPGALGARAQDPAISKALAPAVESALITSIRTNPRALADILFPVIGPAIRKSVGHLLTGMIESLNRTLEHSLSPQSLRWRIEALRTGKPFSEILLLRTLLYRVEQVFLIHIRSGLLLQHMTAPSISEKVQDTDMVSAMLTAIRDFVRDSFGGGENGESLESLRIGELDVWVEQGPEAILAVVIRGVPPKELRITLQETLEAIHLRLQAELKAFQGDTAPFVIAHDYLEPCLRLQHRVPQSSKVQSKVGTEQRKRKLWLKPLSVVFILLLVMWGINSWRESSRWSQYLNRLREEPGLIVISEQTRWGKHYIVGLRDPLSRDPSGIVKEVGLDSDRVFSRWEPYQALLPEFVIARAQSVLQAPRGVGFKFENGILFAYGAVDQTWLAQATQVAKLIPGVKGLHAGDSLESVLIRLKQEIEGYRIGFSLAAVDFFPNHRGDWGSLLAQIKELIEISRESGRVPHVTAVGYASRDGASSEALKLSQTRAENVLNALLAAGLRGAEFASVGRGAIDPTSPLDSFGGRYVTFQVIVENSVLPPSSVVRQP